MSIVKYKNQSGITYAYEATSQYDPVTKQSRPKRKYLGRVDPETGEIIPTAGKRGRPPKKRADSSARGNAARPDPALAMDTRLSEAEAKIEELKAANQGLREENRRLVMFLTKLVKDSSVFLDEIHDE